MAARISSRNMNERVQCVGLPQSLNERRLDNMRDKGEPPASTTREAEKIPNLRKRGGRTRCHPYSASCEPIPQYESMKITYQISSRRNWNANDLQPLACLADRSKGRVGYVGFDKNHSAQRFRVLVDQELVGREGERRYRLGAPADRKRRQRCVFEKREDRQESIQWKRFGCPKYINDELFEVREPERLNVLSSAR